MFDFFKLEGLLNKSHSRALRELLAKSNEKLPRNTKEGSRANATEVSNRPIVSGADSSDGEEEAGKTKEG